MDSFATQESTRGRARRLALVTDAWHPQTNGVVNTLTRLVNYLSATGTEVLVICPDGHRTVPFPSYPEVRVAWDPWKAIERLTQFRPDMVHIATEGPLGLWIRNHLARHDFSFTTSFHTRFPEYLSARLPVPLSWGYAFERWFHGSAQRTLVGTDSLIQELKQKKIGQRLVHWPRGVDTDLFRPDRRSAVFSGLPRPVLLYVGRVAVEKNLEAFLSLDLPGTKVVVGDGPARSELQEAFPDVVWRGFQFGTDLAEHYASADCFVFPSTTETFGNVILEAMSSGLPVAAMPSPGPSDLIKPGLSGGLSDNLLDACRTAMTCSGAEPRATALRFSWPASHEIFRRNLVSLIETKSPLHFLSEGMTRRTAA